MVKAASKLLTSKQKLSKKKINEELSIASAIKAIKSKAIASIESKAKVVEEAFGINQDDSHIQELSDSGSEEERGSDWG